MADLLIRVVAPFAAYRDVHAPLRSYPIMTHTAAWGLLLGIAGIETRAALDTPVTLTRKDAPCLEIAIGQVREGSIQSVYQQLHAYEVSRSSAETGLARFREGCKGAKYRITPKRRDVLVGLDCVLGVRASPVLVGAIKAGILGEVPHYGVPFAGDNNFFLERLEVTEPVPARWCVATSQPNRGLLRLPVWNDRGDSRRNRYQTFLFSDPNQSIPDSAWVTVGPPREG